MRLARSSAYSIAIATAEAVRVEMDLRVPIRKFFLKQFGVFAATVWLTSGICAANLCAQTAAPEGAQSAGQTPGQSLGQVMGDDVSVIGPSNVMPGGPAQAIAFASGSTIVVHSGKARVEFRGGGELDVCGPAKFTVLASGEALTVALSFGRVHAKFGALRPITIYTPEIVATPMAIGNQPRDITLGLSDTGAMCVLAARGAVQVQQQLSGETLVVPQPSEVLLQGTSLGAAPAAAGTCTCNFDEPVARNTVPSAQIAKQTPRRAGANSAPSEALSPPQPAIAKIDSSSQHAAARSMVSVAPPVKQLVLKITMPPIGYDAKSAIAPAEPLSVATLILAKDAQVEPAWIFHGLVAAPKRTRAAAPRRQPEIVSENKSKPAEKAKKAGFWSKFLAFFSGGPRKSPCAGTGCD